MNEAEFMQFRDWIPKIESEDTSVWVSLYKEIKDSTNDLVIYSALLRKEHVETSLKNYSWDFSITDIHGNENVIPILIKRHFYGLKKDYWEITEEIRLFFNLFQNSNKFIYIDDNGDEEEVIIISKDEVKIKRTFLKEFLFAKEYVLAQFYDLFRYSNKKIEELNLEKINSYKKEPTYAYHLHLDNDSYSLEERKSISSIIGKSIISVSDSFKSNLFSKTKVFEDFFIRLDKDGNKISFTCDEKFLANYFGANEGNPHYLTPIYFEKKVLDKYYADHEKYSIQDGYLSCQGLWGLRLDNNHKDYVMVFLGDLGHLSNKEQKHWKNYNIVIDGKISHTCFQRGFMAEFCDPDSADLFFKQKFKIFQTNWHKKYGWHLFLPLNSEDEHHFTTLRIPTKESQEEFDYLISSITKILIDSVNVQELKIDLVNETSDSTQRKKVNSDFILKEDDKSLEILRKYLAQNHNLQFPEMFQFLRDLQSLRSSGIAHRKGNNYESVKKKFGLNNNFKEVFEKILINCIHILNTLSTDKYNLL